MAGVSVVAWKKFGHDRLYVNDELGERIGWFDVKAGTAVLEQVSRRVEFEAALHERGIDVPLEGPTKPPQYCTDDSLSAGDAPPMQVHNGEHKMLIQPPPLLPPPSATDVPRVTGPR